MTKHSDRAWRQYDDACNKLAALEREATREKVGSAGDFITVQIVGETHSVLAGALQDHLRSGLPAIIDSILVAARERVQTTRAEVTSALEEDQRVETRRLFERAKA